MTPPSLPQPSDKVEVSTETLFAALDVLRLAHVYALLHVAPDEIADDFKPHKWEGFEMEFAQDSVNTYKRLLAEMGEAMGVIAEAALALGRRERA